MKDKIREILKRSGWSEETALFSNQLAFRRTNQNRVVEKISVWFMEDQRVAFELEFDDREGFSQRATVEPKDPAEYADNIESEFASFEIARSTFRGSRSSGADRLVGPDNWNRQEDQPANVREDCERRTSVRSSGRSRPE